MVWYSKCVARNVLYIMVGAFECSYSINIKSNNDIPSQTPFEIN